MPDRTDVSVPARDASHDIPYAAEVRRKVLHLLALVVPLGVGLLGKTGSLYVLVPLSLLALLGDILRVRSEGVARFVGKIFGFMMRRDEVPPVGGPIRVNGATWVLLSATLLTFVFPVRIAVPAFAMFMIADAAAALVGRRFGRLHWGANPRTVEGSVAFAVTGFVIMALFPTISLWIGAVGVVCAAVAEALPRPFNDNLRVPFVAALVIFLLERFVLGLEIHLFLR